MGTSREESGEILEDMAYHESRDQTEQQEKKPFNKYHPHYTINFMYLLTQALSLEIKTFKEINIENKTKDAEESRRTRRLPKKTRVAQNLRRPGRPASCSSTIPRFGSTPLITVPIPIIRVGSWTITVTVIVVVGAITVVRGGAITGPITAAVGAIAVVVVGCAGLLILLEVEIVFGSLAIVNEDLVGFGDLLETAGVAIPNGLAGVGVFIGVALQR